MSQSHRNAPDARPYNPLSLEAIGESLLRELESRPSIELPALSAFRGGGLYALYYRGTADPYTELGRVNREHWQVPIYVGKAAKDLFGRVMKHSRSIEAANGLDLADFSARVLVVEPIWIPLVEDVAIQRYKPVWNGKLKGFGNNDPGAGRLRQKQSDWDVLHPGRLYAAKLKPSAPARRATLLEQTRRHVDDSLRAAELLQAGSEPTPPQPERASPGRHSRAVASPRPKRR